MREEEGSPAEASEAEDSTVIPEDALEAVTGGTYAPNGAVLDHGGTSGTSSGPGSGYRPPV